MLRSISLRAVAAATLIASAVGAQQPAGRAAAARGAPMQPAAPVKGATVEGITEYTLANGLRVLLFPDQSKPQTTVNITYLVGSRHEGYGETGMAHLFEHMLFKGTPRHRNIPAEIEARGARYNATTSFDRTIYYETFAAADSNLAWALDLEADRMRNAILERKDLESEFPVVRNEFQSGENNPALVTIKRVLGSAYNHHAYGHLPIGAQSDIENVSLDRMRVFYDRYYQPDNAILMIAGRFDPARALALVQEKFGAIPRPARGLEATYTVEPPQDGEREVWVRRAGDEQMMVAYHKVPPGAHADYAAVDVLNEIMAAAPAGRLYKALVESKKAANVGALKLQQREPGGVFWIVTMRKTDALDAARAALLTAIDSIVARPPAAEEVDRARANLLKNIELALTRSDQIGLDMSEWIAMGDWRLFFLHRDRVAKVTPADVHRVARAYLIPTNRTIGYYQPTAEPMRAELPLMSDSAVVAMVKDYTGNAAVAEGEAFDPTPANIEGRVQRGTLTAGAKLVLMPKKTRGESVTGSLTLRFGDEQTLGGKGQLASVTAQMLMRGSTTRSRQAIRDELDRLKARVTVVSLGAGAVRADFETTRPNVDAVIALVGDVLRNPAFDPREFEELVRQSTAQIEAQRSDPTVLAQVTFSRTVSPYPKGHPRYIATLEEQLEGLKTLTPGALAEFHAGFYGAGNGEVTLVGDVDPEEARRALEAALGGWTSRAPYAPVPMRFQPVAGATQNITTPDKPNSLFIAGHSFAMQDSDPDYPALALANYILGEGALNSRIVQRIRVKESLSYSAGSSLSVNARDALGQFIGFAIQAPANVDRVEQAFREELERALRDGFTAEEVAQAKTGWAQQRQVQRSQDRALAGMLGNAAYLGRTMAWDAELEGKVAALTPDQLGAALRKWIDPAKLTVVRAGDFTKTEQAGQPTP